MAELHSQARRIHTPLHDLARRMTRLQILRIVSDQSCKAQATARRLPARPPADIKLPSTSTAAARLIGENNGRCGVAAQLGGGSVASFSEIPNRLGFPEDDGYDFEDLADLGRR